MPVCEQDDVITLQKKIDATLPFLIGQLYAHLNGEILGVATEGGLYRRKICERDYTIQPDVDTLQEISAKIRSQKAYRGAILILGDKKFYISDIEQI